MNVCFVFVYALILWIWIEKGVIFCARKTGQSNFAGKKHTPKSKKWKLPSKKLISHNEKVAKYPSNSFWKAGSYIIIYI